MGYLSAYLRKGFRLMCWRAQTKYSFFYQAIENKFSFILAVIDTACESDNFDSLPTLTCRPIMCATSIITPTHWTEGHPVVLLFHLVTIILLYWPAILQRTLYPICACDYQSESGIVHLMPLRQLYHDECHSRVCVSC